MRFKNIGLKIISLVLALAIIAPLVGLIISPTAFAGGYNGSGGGSSGGVQSSGSAPGFDESYSGYRVALVDRDSGKVLKNTSSNYMVKDLVNNFTSNYVNAFKVNKVRTDSTNLGIIPQMPIPTSMPLPLGYDAPEFVGQGAYLRNWMMSARPDIYKLNVNALVSYCFGQTGQDLLKAGKAKLTIEMLYQIPLYSTYDNSGYTGYDFYGTFYSSLEFIDKFLAGGGYMGPVVRVAATALYLEKNDLGLTVPSGGILSSIRNKDITYITSSGIGSLGLGIHIYDVEPPNQSVKIVHHVYNVNITLPQGTIFTTSSGQQIPLTEDNCRKLFDGQPIKDINNNTMTPTPSLAVSIMKFLTSDQFDSKNVKGSWDTPITYEAANKNKASGFDTGTGSVNGRSKTTAYYATKDPRYILNISAKYPGAMSVMVSSELVTKDSGKKEYIGPESNDMVSSDFCSSLWQRQGGDALGGEFKIVGGPTPLTAKALAVDSVNSVMSTLSTVILQQVVGVDTGSTFIDNGLCEAKGDESYHTATYVLSFTSIPTDVYTHETTVGITLDDGDDQPNSFEEIKQFVKDNPDKVDITWKEPVTHNKTTEKIFKLSTDKTVTSVNNTPQKGYITGFEGYTANTGSENPGADPGHNPYPTNDPVADRKETTPFNPDTPDKWEQIPKTEEIPTSAKQIDEIHIVIVKIEFHGSTTPTVRNDRIKTYDVSQFIDQTKGAVQDSVHIKALADGVNTDCESTYNNSVMVSCHITDKTKQAVIDSHTLSFTPNDKVKANNYTDRVGDEVEAAVTGIRDQRHGSHSSSCYDDEGHLNCSSHHHYYTNCSTNHGAIHKYDCHYTKESVKPGYGLVVNQVTHYEDVSGNAKLTQKSGYKAPSAITNYTEVGFTIPKDYYVHQNVVKWGTNGSNSQFTYLPAPSGSTNEFTTFDVLLDAASKEYRLKYYNDADEVKYQSKTQTTTDKDKDKQKDLADMQFDYLSADDNGIKIDGAKFLSHRDLLSGDDVSSSLAVAGYMAKYAHNANTNAYLYFMKNSGFEFQGVNKGSLTNKDSDSSLSFSSATNGIDHANRTIWVANAAKLDQLESSPYGNGDTYNTNYAGGPAKLGLTTETHVRFGLGGKANTVGVSLYKNFIANSSKLDDASLDKKAEDGDALRSIWYTPNISIGAEYTACHSLYDSPGHGTLTCGGQCCGSKHSSHTCPYKPNTYHTTKNDHKDWTSVSDNKYVLYDTGNNYLTNGHYNNQVIFDGKTQSDMFDEIYTSRLTFHVPVGVEGTTAGSFSDLRYKATDASGKTVDNAELSLDGDNNLTVSYTDSKQDEWKKNTARMDNNYQKLGESKDKGNMLSRYTFTTPTGDYTFNPAYYMQYDDELEDVNKAVWMLSHQPRKINFRDTLTVELDYGDGSSSSGGAGGHGGSAGPGEDGVYCTHVTTAWSTDNADTQVHEHTKLPVAKAGNSYQTTTDAVSGSVTAYVVLQDPDFAENPSEVKASNEEKMKTYSEQMEAIRQQFQALAEPTGTSRIPTEENPVVDKDSLSLAMYSNMVNASSMNSAFRITDTQSDVPMLDDKEPMIFSKDTDVSAKVSTGSSSGTGGAGSSISSPVKNNSWTYYALKGYEVKPFDNSKNSQLATGYVSNAKGIDLDTDISDTIGDRKIALGSETFKIEKMPSGVVFNELNNHLCTVMVEPWDTASKSLSSPVGTTPFLDEGTGAPSSGSFNWYSEDYEGFIVAKFEMDFTISGKGNVAAQDKDGYSSGTHSDPTGNAFGTEFRAIYRAESDWRSDVNHLAAQPNHDIHVYTPDTWKNITNTNNKIGNFYLEPKAPSDKTKSVLSHWSADSGMKNLSVGNVKVHYAEGIYGVGVELANLVFTFGDQSGGEQPIGGNPVSFYYQPTYFNIRGSVFDTAR